MIKKSAYFIFTIIFLIHLNAFSQEEKELRVCSEAGYAPFEVVKPNGDWDGYEVQVLKQFALKQHYHIKFINMEYDALIPSLVAKKSCHLIASTLYVNVTRGEMVTFSHPILITKSSTMIRIEDKNRFDSFEKINQKSTRVAVQTGTEDDLYARKYLKNTTVVGYSNNIDPIFALITNKADIFLEDKSYIQLMIKKYPKKLMNNPDVLRKNPDVGVAFGLRKQDHLLIQEINSYIDEATRNGTLTKIQKDYF
jgi:ABC-type amino acid transport substrate-binding protein